MSGKMMVNTVVASGLMLASLLGQSEMSNRLAEQEKTQAASSKAATQSAMEAKTSMDPKVNSPRGRLPRYYSAVVSQAQRSKIYEIQGEFRSRRESLEKQLADLKQQEQEAILSVLREPQKKMIEELRRAAEEKRLARLQSMKSNSAGSKTAASDVNGRSSDE
jgi:hypothetical protein